MNKYLLARKFLVGVFLVAGSLASSGEAYAANFLWNTGDGLFQTGTNWNPNTGPGTGDDAYLRNATPVVVTSNADSTVRFLSVGSQALDANDKGVFTLDLGSTTLTATGSGGAYGIDYTGGILGGTKSLTISSGTLTTKAIRMQQNVSGTSQLHISATGATFNTSGLGATTSYNQIGHSGSGVAQVFIQSGGIWNVTNATTELGSNGVGTGFMRVTGTGSAFNSSSANVGSARLGFYVGSAATGTLEVLNGASFSIDDLNVARNSTSTGTVLVSDANTTLTGNRIMVGGGVNSGGQSPSAGGNGTLTISNGATVNAGSFYVLKNVSTSGTLVLNSGTLNITSDQIYNDSTIIGNGTISGTVRMNTAGAVLSGSGGALNLGALVVATSGTLGSGTVSVSGTTIINTNRVLTVNGTLDGAGGLTLDGSLAGTGTVNKAVVAVANTISSSGTLTLGSSYTITGNFGPSTISAGTIAVSGTTNVLSNKVLNNNGTLAGTGNLVVSGSIGGSGTVNKTGGTINGGGTINQGVTLGGNTTLGTVILSSTLTVTGASNSVAAGTSPTVAGLTTIASGGALALNGTLGGAGALTVNGTLSGTGTVGKAVTVQTGGTLAVGNSPGTMTFNSNLALNGGSASTFEVNGLTSGLYDLALGGAGSQTVNFGGTLNLAFQAGFNTEGSVVIFNFENYSGNFSSVVSTGLASGYTASFNQINGEITVVPEPSTWALIGVGLMVTLFSRKRRG